MNEQQHSGRLVVGLRGRAGAPPLGRLSPLRCPCCNRPFAEGGLGAGSVLLVRCANRRCLAHDTEQMIAVYPEELHGAGPEELRVWQERMLYPQHTQAEAAPSAFDKRRTREGTGDEEPSERLTEKKEAH